MTLLPFQIQLLTTITETPFLLNTIDLQVTKKIIDSLFDVTEETKGTIPVDLAIVTLEEKLKSEELKEAIDRIVKGTYTFDDLYKVDLVIKDLQDAHSKSSGLTPYGLNPRNKSNYQIYFGKTNKLHQVVEAMPLTRGQYNLFTNTEPSVNENPYDAGMWVTVIGSEVYNWVPMTEFLDKYEDNGNFTFGNALILLSWGKRIHRRGWNGSGMWVEYRGPSKTYVVVDGEETEFVRNAYMELINPVNKTVSMWVPSSTDLNADDWGFYV